eukprot:91924-Rhodomonas_salina.3
MAVPDMRRQGVSARHAQSRRGNARNRVPWRWFLALRLGQSRPPAGGTSVGSLCACQPLAQQPAPWLVAPRRHVTSRHVALFTSSACGVVQQRKR